VPAPGEEQDGEGAEGDLLKADAEALVNTVNCVGVMGRGIALQFKKAFPANYQTYHAACKRGEVRPGHMLVHDLGPLARPRYVINWYPAPRKRRIASSRITRTRWPDSTASPT
jgi:O-acetyl-ADP-ribose deacetylase (regulator of RNase III)